MPTMRRKDFDEELVAWLELVHAEQAPAAQLDELWRANEAAKAVKDPGSPAAADAHGRIDRALTALGY